MSDTTTPSRSPVPALYIQWSILLVGLVALSYILFAGQAILVPLLFALLLAMLLDPLVMRMQRRVHRVLAITVAVLLAMLVLVGLAYFITTQAMHFSETLPQLKEKLNALGKEMERWAQQHLNMDHKQVNDAMEKVKDEGMAKGGTVVGRTLTAMGTLFAFFFLLPVFTFLLLFYKRLLLSFIARLFPVREHGRVTEILGQTKGVVASYLMGLVFEAAIITALNWVGLMVIGVPYALLLAVIAAVLNLIPYIGMIIATALPMVLALATMEPVDALWVLLLYAVVQFIDNNFIVPRVVASRIQLNALVSIVVVMAGGALWGVPGMFLSLPLTAMLKVTFDRVQELEAFGYVLGDDEPRPGREIFGWKGEAQRPPRDTTEKE